MQLTEERKEHSVILTVSGRIDVETSVILEQEIAKWFPALVVRTLVLDFSAVEYISSAGVRVLLSAQKRKKESLDLIIKNPSPFCKQVFDVTGADIFLKIDYTVD